MASHNNISKHHYQVRELGVFDISTLDSITLNNPEQRKGLVALVASLVAASSDDLNEALALWQASEHIKASKKLHSLRGSVGNLGAKRFAEATVAIERAILQDTTAVESNFLTARVELACTMSLAEKWLYNESVS